MMDFRWKIHGADEVNRVFRRLPDRVRKNQLQASLRKGANLLRDAVRANAPIGTKINHPKYGRLVDNIVVRVISGLRNSADVARLAVTTGRAFWGNFSEFGTQRQPARPFVRPALDENAAAIVNTVGVELGKGVEKEAKALAGSYAGARRRIIKGR